MNLPIRVDTHREYVTISEKRKVRFLGMVSDDQFPIVGVVTLGNGKEMVTSYALNGAAEYHPEAFSLEPLKPEYHDQWRCLNIVTGEITQGGWWADQSYCMKLCKEYEVPCHIEWRT